MIRWTAVASAIAALAIGGVIEASGAPGGHPATFTVHVSPALFTLVNNEPKDTVGPGDQTMATEAATKGGTKVGHTVYTCAIVTKQLVAQCSFTLKLSTGQVQYAGAAPPGGTHRFAIVGGTGDFNGASGFVEGKSTNASGSEHDLTFHFK